MDDAARRWDVEPSAPGTTERVAVLRIVLAVLALAVFAKAAILGWRDPLLFAALDNDSAMRLVGVRDLLGGQGWFDLVQRRLGPPGGIEMHWSRLVDAPLAALISAFDLVLDRSGAERATLIFWPLLMLGLAVILVSRISASLGPAGSGLLGGAVALLALGSSGRFAPGAIDHHGVQVVLLLAVVLGLLRRNAHAAAPIAAGAATAASLAVGVETLPILGALGATAALLWVVDPRAERRSAAGYGLSLAGASLGFFALTAPSSAWRGGACDAMSLDLLALVVPAGLGLAWVATVSTRAGLAARVLALGGVGAGTLALCLAAAPACLSNPIDAIGPYLEARWLDLVAEAQGFGAVISGAAAAVNLGYYALGAFALVASLVLAARERSGTWALLSVAVAAALAIAVYQVRGVTMLLPLCIPPAVALAMRSFHEARRENRPLLGLLPPLLALMPVPAVWSAALDLAAPSQSGAASAAAIGTAADPATCWTGAGAERLAALPPGTVSAGSNLGSAILLFTPHRVLSAPYHRNVAGMTDQLRIALAGAGEARALLREAGADYLVLCRPDGELRLLARAGYAGFLGQVEQGDVPTYLAPLSPPDDPLQIYRVD